MVLDIQEWMATLLILLQCSKRENNLYLMKSKYKEVWFQVYHLTEIFKHHTLCVTKLYILSHVL